MDSEQFQASKSQKAKNEQILGSWIKDYPDVMDIRGMCSLLKISTKTGYLLLQSGAIHSTKVGRLYRISKRNILKYLGMTE